MNFQNWLKRAGGALAFMLISAGATGLAHADCRDELSTKQCGDDTGKFKNCKDGTYFFQPSSGLFCTPMGHTEKSSKKLPHIATAGGFCSVKMIAELRATDGCSGGVGDYGEKFRPACNQHDICYSSPTGGGKNACDSAFGKNMIAMCDRHGQTGCVAAAKTMLTAVQIGGYKSASDGRQWSIDNCTNADHYGRLKSRTGNCIDLEQTKINRQGKPIPVDGRKCHGGSDHRWRYFDASNKRMIQNSMMTGGDHNNGDRICLVAPPNSRTGTEVYATACPSQKDLDSGKGKFAQWTRKAKSGTGYHTFESAANPGLCLGLQVQGHTKTRDKIYLRSCDRGSEDNKLWEWKF